MRDKYGPVIGVKLGFVNAVIVCGGKEVREVLKREEFQGRPGGVYREGENFSSLAPLRMKAVMKSHLFLDPNRYYVHGRQVLE